MRGLKRSGSVFSQMVVSYILFAVLLVAGVYVCMFGILAGIGGGRVNTLVPYNLIDGKGQVKDISTLKRNGGWIEQLDTDYCVRKIYGEKKDMPQSYTQDEIYEYLITDNVVDTDSPAAQYRGFLKIADVDGEKYYFLVKIRRDVLSLAYNYNVGSSTGSSGIAGMFFVLFLLFFLGNCLLMSRYLSRKIKKPLDEITDGMEQVIQSGVDQVRLDFPVQKEFEKIRDSFNIMTERMEAEKREKRINENKKNRMLLELSHDIKTPVATIKSYANALEAGLIKEDEQKECCQVIDRKAGRVDELVNEMFLLLKLDSPEYELQTEQADICEAVRSICAEYYEELSNQGIRMHIEIPGRAILVEIDKKEFARVIENLLSNILKYNRSGHEAWLSLRQDEEYVFIQVMDDGEAIADDIRPYMFDPFVRGDKARTSEGGTGLGLAIAKKIMEKLGGDIQYEFEDGINRFELCLNYRSYFS